MKRLALSLVAVLVLAGCETQARLPIVVQTKEEVKVDTGLLKECPKIVDLKGPTDVDNQEFTSKFIDEYVACANNNASLIRIVKKAFNIKVYGEQYP